MSVRMSSEEKKDFAKDLMAIHGHIVRRKDIVAYAADIGQAFPHWILSDKTLKAGHGHYNINNYPR